MITPEDEARVLTRAYVPEHIVGLMVSISKGEPFLIEDYLGLVRDNWLIFVGYPFETEFSLDACESVLERVMASFRPQYLWFVGPEVPPSLLDSCKERQSDQYYSLPLDRANPKPSLQRLANKVSGELSIERGRSISEEHQQLVKELLQREKMPPSVHELYRAMPDYISHSPSTWTLDARNKRGQLCAFFVVELGAKNFSTYVLGSHSKRHYVPHASDLLFLEMINLSLEHGKRTINLGIGVDEGIRRFKEKWGGVPFLSYAFHISLRLGKKMRYFETVDDQSEALDGIPFERFVDYLNHIEHWGGYKELFLKAFLEGDLGRFVSLTSVFPTRCESILAKRDVIFFEGIRDSFTEGKTVGFAEVAHIPGIRKLFLDDGYKVIQEGI